MSMSEPEDDKTVNFLITEYETLRTLRQDYISLGDNRFNFYLAILSGAAVFITWINSSEPVNLSPSSVNFITVMIVTGVLALGFTTLNRVVRRNRKINEYSRGMSRIRRYFADQKIGLEDYLIMTIEFDEPKFKGLSFGEQLPIMLSVLNGLVAGGYFGTVGIQLLIGTQWSIWFAIIGALVISAFLIHIQLCLYENKMFDEEHPDKVWRLFCYILCCKRLTKGVIKKYSQIRRRFSGKSEKQDDKAEKL